ncbi:hypothetical protein [Pseudoroseicyclus tamaricis]|uniref:Sulfotransferase family protein n=1 Tax=Pseudoroseicyclus tamaricis TaxID=2705421 RepID=A0A6B2JWD7_9RHOB|nr:hypothetical protein [Pseudoroseicyclus tamaricis]NDV00959.1 hypothetical protein [Pseudoroseicyclus tamaricis]
MSDLPVFIHVPKTAGSTLNAALVAHHASGPFAPAWRALPAPLRDNSVLLRRLGPSMGGGLPHAGHYEGEPEKLTRLLREARWASGHIQRRRFAPMAAVAGRSPRWVSVLRDPTEQVASHYQWWIEIHERGWLRFRRYPPFFRDLSRQIRAADNSDPEAVIPFLALHHTLFLNLQADYLMPEGRETPVEAMPEALATFAGLGLGSDIAPAFRAMTGAEAPPLPRHNASRSRFDRAVFRTERMREFLAEHNALDERLWALAQERRG